MLRQVAIEASEGHRAFAKLLKRVCSSDEHLILKRDGTPVAVLMSYQEYRKLIAQRSGAALKALGREFGREIDRQGVSEADPRLAPTSGSPQTPLASLWVCSDIASAPEDDDRR